MWGNGGGTGKTSGKATEAQKVQQPQSLSGVGGGHGVQAGKPFCTGGRAKGQSSEVPKLGQPGSHESCVQALFDRGSHSRATGQGLGPSSCIKVIKNGSAPKGEEMLGGHQGEGHHQEQTGPRERVSRGLMTPALSVPWPQLTG